jgi:hypothetical protein
MAMMQASARSLRVRSLSRFALVVTLVSVGVGSFAGVASAAAPVSQLWVERFNGPKNSYDAASALGVSPDGSEVIVTGRSAGSSIDYVTVAYDTSTGAELWVKRYNGAANGDDYATALGVSTDGSEVFVTGYSPGSTSGSDYATLAYDASSGSELWVKRYNGSAKGGGDYALALQGSSDGSTVFVTGQSAGSTAYDYATVAYDTSSGSKVWVKRYNGSGHSIDVPSALGVSPDGSEVFVTGGSYGSTRGGDFATVAYEASTGSELWSKRYNGSANGGDGASALGVTPDGSEVVVTGPSLGPTSYYDYLTVAYDTATGAKLWAKRYYGPGSSSDRATALGVSPDGSTVFVTGGTASTDYDYLTVAYDTATGWKLWAKRYHAPPEATTSPSPWE